MASKAEILSISKLKLKKHRESEQKFLAEGKRLIEEGINSEFICEKILLTSDFKNKESSYISFLEQKSKPYLTITSKEFQKISSTKNPQGIIAVFVKSSDKSTSTFDNSKIIALENISDPGNVGTILRSCDWFGIKTVLLSKDCAEIYNPKVIRASMGAIFNLRVIVDVDLIETICELKEKNYKSYFADMNGEDYRDISYNEKFILTLCNEAFGPSAELKNVCDKAVTIPKIGKIDSLNVSAAAAVILSQIA